MAGRPGLTDPDRPSLVGIRPPGGERLRAGGHLIPHSARTIAGQRSGLRHLRGLFADPWPPDRPCPAEARPGSCRRTRHRATIPCADPTLRLKSAIPSSSIPWERASVANSLIVEERSGFGIAAVMSRKDVSAAALGTALGFSLPEGPVRVKGDGMAWIGTGPTTWLALTDTPENGWPASLEQRLKGLGSISDQSGSYRIFRIAGDKARSLLQRGALSSPPTLFGEDRSRRQ